MKYLSLALASFMVIVAQMIVGNSFFLFDFLDLSTILVMYWALYRSRMQALFVGSVAGLFLDAAMGWPLGYHGFGKTVGAFVIGAAAKRFNIDGTPVRFALIAISSLSSSFCVFVLLQLLQRAANSTFLTQSLTQAVITAAVGVLCLSLLDALERARVNRAG